MVSIPVGLYPAVQEKDLRFNQIHEKCGSRIRLQRYCPKCERVVELDEIQRGFQVSKGRYAIVTDEDFEEVPVPSKHVITVDAFVEANEVEPVYFDTSYYLQPEEAGRKPFALLMRALKEKGKAALAKIAIRNKENLCLLIAQENGVLLETLYYPDEIREPAEVKLGDVKLDEREVKLALSLVDLLSDEFHPEKYKDEYREALMQRIEAKAQGRELQEAPDLPDSKVIDLFEALKSSLESAKQSQGQKKRRKSG